MWLKATNKLERLELLIEKVCKFNGSSEKNLSVEKVESNDARDNKEVWKMWREILKNAEMIYRVVVAVFAWLIVSSA